MLKQIVSSAFVITASAAFLPATIQTASAAAKPTTAQVAHDPVHEVRRVMAEVADRAMGDDPIAAVLELVNKPDRDRIEKDITKKQDKAYQDLADKVRALWKEKYDHNFSAEGHVDQLTGLDVHLTGTGKDEKATVDFPAQPGEPPYELHMVRQASNHWWRIELPDSLTGKNFYPSLQASLQKVIDEKDKLPAAENKAYERVVTWVLHEMAFPKGAK